MKGLTSLRYETSCLSAGLHQLDPGQLSVSMSARWHYLFQFLMQIIGLGRDFWLGRVSQKLREVHMDVDCCGPEAKVGALHGPDHWLRSITFHVSGFSCRVLPSARTPWSECVVRIFIAEMNSPWFYIGIVNNSRFEWTQSSIPLYPRHIGNPQGGGEDILCQPHEEKCLPASKTCGGNIYQVVFHSSPSIALCFIL